MAVTAVTLDYQGAALDAWRTGTSALATQVQAQSLAASLGLFCDVAVRPDLYLTAEGIVVPRASNGAPIVGVYTTPQALRHFGDPRRTNSLEPRIALASYWALRQLARSRGVGERSAGNPLGIAAAVALGVGAVAAATAVWRWASTVEVREATRVREIEAAARASVERHERIMRTGREEAPGPVEQAARPTLERAAEDGWKDVASAARSGGLLLFGAAALAGVLIYGGKTK